MMNKMNRDVFDKAYDEIDDFRDKLGEVLVDEVMSEDNPGLDMAKGVISTFSMCQTEREFEIANSMLAAICGWNFDSLVEKIKEYDADEDYCWESVW